MTHKKKYIRRNYDKKTYFKGDFTASRLEEFEETLALISSKYKYVRFGLTTDLKEEYDLRKSHDNISWSKMVLLYTTPLTLEAEYFYVHTRNKENYIPNNKLKFPLTLFDKYEMFYVYVMVGRRKKSIKVNKITQPKSLNNSNFSIFDFCKKENAKGIHGIYDEACLNEDGSIISMLDQAAIISHHLQLSGTPYNETYQDKGEKLVELWKEFLCGYKTKKNVVEESSPSYFGSFFDDVYNAPFRGPENPKFTFIDLFAGIGGFRLAMQAQGGKCVFSSEWNEYAQKTYYANYGEMPFGDITKESTKQLIPQGFDVLCAGFPCQPFSIAGVSKKKSLGRETGFKDKTQGTLFFDVADIIQRYRPKAFYLENVKNLCSHDKGNTFRVICETLNELNYSIHFKVMDGKAFVPQHRERIFIVGFDRNRYQGNEHFDFPVLGDPIHKIKDILDNKVDPKYTLSDKLWDYLQNYAVKQKAKGNGFGYGLVDLNGIARTLSARYYKDGSEILIPQKGKNPRKLTPRECSRLMGYPDNFIIDRVSDIQAYRQCGNSVVVPLITAVAEKLVNALEV